MIPIILRDLRWRMAVLLLLAWVMFMLEPGFHQHGALPPGEAIGLSAVGISATLSYFAGLSMIILLGGFISTDRREGYTRIFFSSPTRPLAFYGLRWIVALMIALTGAALFLVIGQVIAWGEFRGGFSGLLLALVSALVYGGLMAFLSATLPRGDGWIAFLMILPTFIPQIFSYGLAGLPPFVRQVVQVVMPPHGALQVIWQGLLEGTLAWGAIGFATGYAAFWLIGAIAILRVREMP
jgi:hypothetical protein